MLDQKQQQKEILKGNYYLNMWENLNIKTKINKFAAEPLAFHLHKRRDFISRLVSNKQFLEDQERIEYENILWFLASSSDERAQILQSKSKL